MPDIIAVTRDGVSLRFPCSESTYVLDAAEEAGLYLPSVCRHGRCGTCRARVVSGAYGLAAHEAKLPDEAGEVLLCRLRPREALTIALPCRDAQVGRASIPERRASIAAASPCGEGWLAFSAQLAPGGEHGQAAAFTPGQAMELTVPGTGARCVLPMANLPNDEGRLEFLLPMAANEALCAWLVSARRGTEVLLRGPLGRFGLDETSPRPRCLIGAGGGLAPLLALLRHLAALRDRTRMEFIFAASPAERFFLEQTLAPLRAALPQLGLTLPHGHPETALTAALEKMPGADIYASGPPQLLAKVAAAATAHGVPEARVRAEGTCG